ncbi:MAG: DUF3489 domain-containing protein [Pseudomonadota bacterium]|nr:DUF3489 domain-containing protein [Pseudomonadota bacterium]
MRPGSKQNLLVEQLGRDSGVAISELTRVLGWLPHTVRAAITGLRQKGFEVTRTKNDGGETVYRASPPPAGVSQSDPASLS